MAGADQSLTLNQSSLSSSFILPEPSLPQNLYQNSEQAAGHAPFMQMLQVPIKPFEPENKVIENDVDQESQEERYKKMADTHISSDLRRASDFQISDYDFNDNKNKATDE